jgi:hypothetical protein
LTKKPAVVLLPRIVGWSRLPSPCPMVIPGVYRVTSAMLCIRWSAITFLPITVTD